jgi:hypothetical protein
MTHLSLGPNGGLVYCMEYLEKNLDWLRQKLQPLKDRYLLFDFPGQVGWSKSVLYIFKVFGIVKPARRGPPGKERTSV